MTILTVETDLVRDEKLSEFDPLLNEFLKYKATHQDLFKGPRSWKLFKRDFGGISGLYIEMWEFDSLADMETIQTRMHTDQGMKRIDREFHQLEETTSFPINIWHPVA